MKSVKAFAPATIANFNVGFDVIGLSLNNIGDDVELTVNNTEKNRITKIVNGSTLPFAVDENCCSMVIRKMQEHLNNFTGVDIIITKGFPAGSGLGSSSASSAAAAVAYNELLGQPFTKKELVGFAAEGERVACGSAHADNVAPSIYGGLVLIVNGDSDFDLIELPIPDNLFAVTVFPKIKVNTSESRKILKNAVPLNTVSKQLGVMGAFVSSLYENDMKRFSNALQDFIIEPMRSILIPKFDELKASALTNNALAFGISGSGPSVFAIAEGQDNAEVILKGLKEVYKDVDIDIETYINKLSKNSGARITQ